MSEITFGTDGWRAIIADQFTAANVARVTVAAAEYWNRNPPAGSSPRVVVGYDRRFGSDYFARLAAQVFCLHGFDVILAACATPTPAVSYWVPRTHAVGGVMITASHNPAAFNGYKLKGHLGNPADGSMSRAVEALVPDTVTVPDLVLPTNSRLEIADIRPPYFRAIKQLIDYHLIARSGLHIAHDALFGVGADCFAILLAGTRCAVTNLNAEHDPNFGGINPEPVPQNYARSSLWLRRHPHDLCLVTDGDADRIGGMDGHGRPLSTHQLYCLLLHHLRVNRHQGGRVIKALTTTSMVDRMCQEHGLELVETSVGFKHIAAEMLKGPFLLGGEESGGIGFPGHVPERDGLLAGLMLLELLAVERKTINQLIAGLRRRYGSFHYARIDIRLPVELRAGLMQFCARQPPNRLRRSPLAEVKTYDGVKYVARDGSWLMLRGSGTESVLRIYAEADTPLGAQQLLRQGTRLARFFTRKGR